MKFAISITPTGNDDLPFANHHFVGSIDLERFDTIEFFEQKLI